MRRVVALIAICALLLPAAGFSQRALATAADGDLATALEFLICRGTGEPARPTSGDAPDDHSLPSAGTCQLCVLPVGALPPPIVAVSSRPVAIAPLRDWSAAISPAIVPPWPHRRPPPRAPPSAA